MKYVLCILLILVTLEAFADDRVMLPQLDTVTVTKGVVSPALPDGQYKLANVDQWKQVLLVGINYNNLYDWRLEIQGTLNAYDKTVAYYEAALRNKDQQFKLLEQQNEYLSLRLNQEIKLKSNEDLRNKIEKFVLYGVVVVELVIIGIVGVKGIAQ